MTPPQFLEKCSDLAENFQKVVKKNSTAKIEKRFWSEVKMTSQGPKIENYTADLAKNFDFFLKECFKCAEILTREVKSDKTRKKVLKKSI